MLQVKAYQVLLMSSVIIVTSAILKYLYPELSFVDGGLVTAILLTILVKSRSTTLVFGIIALLLIVLRTFYLKSLYTIKELMLQNAFSLFVVVIAIVAALLIKRLFHSIGMNQQQITALFEHATEGIVLTNQKGEIILINPAALALFRYTKEDLLGKTIELLIPSRFREKHLTYREGFYTKPSNRSMGHGRDLFGLTKDGHEIPVEVSLSYYQQDSQFYVIAFIVDITQRKEHERRMVEQKEQLIKVTEDIRKLNAELENKVEERTLILKEALHELERSQQELSEALEKEKELNEIKSRFVSMASHEFRTPLSTVLSSASLLSKYTLTEEQDKRNRHVQRIKDSVKHLNDLLEDFLSLGKLEEGKVTVKQETVEVKDFLEDVADEMKGILKSGQQIDVAYDGTGRFITDKKLLKNILINLLSNAVKFSKEDACIWLKAHCTVNKLELSVKDTGIGIAPEDQPYMFTSFYRGKNAINIQGTGLGLHIVKRYVELLNGDISLDSELGVGTTFLVELPDLSGKES